MNHKQSVKQLFEALTGHVSAARFSRHGHIRRYQTHLPFLEASAIFDVGANVGQSARKFSKYFPNSEIYCFEPLSETCRVLQREIGARSNVHTFKLALGARSGRRQMVPERDPEMFRLRVDDDDGRGGRYPRRRNDSAHAS
jgi:hypothetical protein